VSATIDAEIAEARELERALVDALISRPALAPSCLEVAPPEAFYWEAPRRLYSLVIKHATNGRALDSVELLAEVATDAPLRQELAVTLGRAALTSNAPHYARRIADFARRRRIRQLAALVAGGEDSSELEASLADALAAPRAPGESKLQGLDHADAVTLEVPATSALVEGCVEIGTVGTIAGLPETWKSAVAVELALKVASGAGRFLGRLEVLRGGAVAYFWQDDSRENELRRMQAYARRHDYLEAPLRWYLNEGLRLPADIAALRAEIERHSYVLVVLDSLYNFLAGVKLKEEDVGELLGQLKAQVCDPTGCSIVTVDHAPWPTEDNKNQRRAYGTVFKAAAIRWSIFIERPGKGLSATVTISGNNLTGLAPTPAVWDADALELRLLDVERADTRELADSVCEWLGRDGNFGTPKSVIEAAIKGRAADIRRILDTDERISKVEPTLVGRPRKSHCYGLTSDLAQRLQERWDDFGTTSGRVDSKRLEASSEVVPDLHVPPKGGRSRDDFDEPGRPDA
jgi:hypothetical protein